MAVSIIRESRKRTIDKADENSDDGVAVFLFVSSQLSLAGASKR